MGTRGVLLYGVEEETRSPVRERIDILERGGGFLFNRVDVLPSNVVAA